MKMIKNNIVQLVYCPTEDQVADIFTKPLKFEDLVKFKIMLGIAIKN